MTIFLQLLVNGLMLGGLFAMIAIGLTLIFGIVRVINFAHGEFLMVGMYAVFLMTGALGVHPYLTAAPMVLLFFVLGAGVQRFIIQPLLDAEDPHVQIFATVGLSTALINLALLVYGADLRTTPGTGVRVPVQIGPVRVLVGQIVMFVSAIALVLGLNLLLNRTYLGRAIRAVAQNRNAAALMGIDVNRIYVVTFGIGSACVGLAAAMVAPMYPVSPTIGTFFVLTAFVVVVLGGMGSIQGAFLGAMIIGVVDSMSGYYVSPDLKEVVYFLIFIAILIWRPTGLLGLGKGSE